MRTHSLPSTRYFALENNVRLRREIFFSASTTEETTVESTTPDIVGRWFVRLVKWLECTWMRSNRVCLPSIRDLCIPRNGHATIILSLDRIHGLHDYDPSCHHGPYNYSSRLISARHHSPFVHHSCVLLFYDHDIMTLTILMTHTFSYLSLTLPGLSLEPHSFDYSSLSHLCSLLLSPPHSLCNRSIFAYDVLSLELLFSHGHSSIYSVVAVRCSSLALIS